MYLPREDRPDAGGHTHPGDDGRLMIRRCTACTKLLAPLTSSCSSCQSTDLEWVASSGEGAIVSWKIVQRSTGNRREATELSTIAVVQLDEGPMVFTTILGEIPPYSKESVRVKFAPIPTVDRFPVFTVDTTSRTKHDWRPASRASAQE